MKTGCVKTSFVKKVAEESKGLTATIANIALVNNDIDELLDVFHEQHNTNPELFRKMVGNDVYSNYLEVLKVG